MKKTVLFTAAVLTAITLLCSCGYGRKDPDQPPLASNSVIVADDSIPDGVSPNINGVITGISEVREGIMLLVEIPDTKNNYSENMFYVTVTKSTVVENAEKKRCEDYRALTPGDTVSVWFTGISTGTTPEFAVAHGIRVTAKVDDLLMTVRLGGSVIMASPTAGEITSTDINPLLYGSYLISDVNSSGMLTLSFAKEPQTVTAYATSLENGETIYLANDGNICELELPGTLKAGEYTVTVKAESEDSADYYNFVLSVR